MLLNDMTSIIKLPDDVFEDVTVETIILKFRKHYANSKSNWKQNDNWNFNIYVKPRAI